MYLTILSFPVQVGNCLLLLPMIGTISSFQTHDKIKRNSAYSLLLEGVEELDNVSGSADVDEQQLGQLIVGEVTLRQHPTTEDQEQ